MLQTTVWPAGNDRQEDCASEHRVDMLQNASQLSLHQFAFTGDEVKISPEGCAGFRAEPCDDVEDSSRKSRGLCNLCELQASNARHFRRLEHNGVARSQCWPNFPLQS